MRSTVPAQEERATDRVGGGSASHATKGVGSAGSLQRGRRRTNDMMEPRVATLRDWASLGRSLRRHVEVATAPPRPFTTSFAGLIAAVSSLREAEFAELSEISRRSRERLIPLGEPLEHDLGVNRWLASAREEAYSDWLAWLLSRMTVEELASVLRLPLLLDLGLDVSGRVGADREVWVQHGHEGRLGRLDILLRVQARAIIALEVKRGSVDEADTEKQIGYVRAIETNPAFAGMTKFYILLVTASDKDEVYGFAVRHYDKLCRNLRRLATAWIAHEGLFPAAIMLAVTASIETNLLRMSLQKGSFTPATLSHLKEFSERSAYALREIRALLQPYPERPPATPPKYYEPPSRGRYRRRR